MRTPTTPCKHVHGRILRQHYCAVQQEVHVFRDGLGVVQHFTGFDGDRR